MPKSIKKQKGSGKKGKGKGKGTRTVPDYPNVIAIPVYQIPDNVNQEFWSSMITHKYNKVIPSPHAPINVLSWFKYFVINMPDSAIKNITEIFPKYATNYQHPHINAISAQLFLLLGIISDILYLGYEIIIKGGKSVQLLLSDVMYKHKSPVFTDAGIPDYISNDIDILINAIPEHGVFSSKNEFAIQLGHFIQWVTAIEGHSSHLSILDSPKIGPDGITKEVGSIVKVSYIHYNHDPNNKRPTFTALMDIGYSDSSELFQPKIANMKFRFSIDHQIFFGKFNTPILEDSIIEKMHYIIAYTSEEMLTDKNLNKFRDSLERSTYALFAGKIMKEVNRLGTAKLRDRILDSLIQRYFDKMKMETAEDEIVEMKKRILTFLKLKQKSNTLDSI